MEKVKIQCLDIRAKGRNVIERGEGYRLRESAAPYNVLFEAENEDIDLENTFSWYISDE